MMFISVASVFLLTACGPTTSMHASFSKNEYAVSVGQTVDFFHELTLENVAPEKIEITFSNEQLFTKTEQNTFIANQSGTTNVYAQTDGNVLASTKVIVKEKFKAPTSFQLDADGRISWTAPTVFVDGKIVSATQYVLMVNGEEHTLDQTEFMLPSKGAYAIQINVLGEQYVDASGFGNVQNIYYGVMNPAKLERFDVSTMPNNHEVTISWGIIANATYNVSVDGIQILSDYVSNVTSINFENYASGRSIHLEIEAVDTTGRNLPSVASFELTKLAKPQLFYGNSDLTGGSLSWNPVENAAGYIIRYVNRSNPLLEGSILIKDPSQTQTLLPNITAGIYDVSIQALGQKGDGILCVNSNAENIDIAKLIKPNLTFNVEQQNVNIIFTEESYVENYAIHYAGKVIYWNTKTQGLHATIDCAALSAGKIDFEIYSYPTLLENGGVKPFSEGGFNTSHVLNSDANAFSIYKLANIESITHRLSDSGSEILFDKVEFADNYTVKVNNIILNDVTTLDENGQILIRLGDLSQHVPVQGKYEIQVTASREDGQAIQIVGKKVLTILPTVAEVENQENGSFAWGAVDNASYDYEIYTVTADYQQGDVLGAPTLTGHTEQLQIDSVLNYGYYVIKVYTKSTDVDNYLDAQFHDSTNVYHAFFHVYQQIETPAVTFEYNEEKKAYVTKISTVAFAGKYEIYVDGTLENSLYSNGSQSMLTYIFQNKFTTAKTYNLQIIAKAGDDFDSTIHTASEPAVCSVKRLGIPTFTLDENETLSVNMDEDAYRVIIRNGATPINGEGETSASLAEYNGEFTIYLQFFAKVAEGSNYYLDGAEGMFAFKRAAIPTNIAYHNGSLIYDCVDDANIEKYIITVTLVNEDNGNYTVTTESDQLSYDLQAYIQQMCNNEKFNSFYSQASAIEVRVSAYRLGESNEVYFLPSKNGTTTSGTEALSLTKLGAPTVSFNTDTLELSYTPVGSVGTTNYTIYADGEAIVDNYTGTTYSLSGLNFSTARVLKVYANNPAYLSSANSNQIIIRQLQSVDWVGVHPLASEDAGITESIYFSVPATDLTHVAKVLCNGSDAAVAFNSVNGYTQLNIDNFETDSTVSVAIALQAKEAEIISGVTYYYIDSVSRSYELKNLAQYAITLQIKDGVLSWNRIATEWQGVEGQPLTYTLSVYKNGTFLKSKVGLTENTFPMDDAFLLGLTTSDYTLEVTAVLKDYRLQATAQTTAKGYYGVVSSEAFTVQKLPSISNVNYTFLEDEQILLETQRKARANLVLSWKNNWEGVANVSFTVILNAGTQNETVISGLKQGSASETFVCRYDADTKTYTLELNQSYFSVGENTIQMTVFATGAITADPFEMTLNRYASVENISINDAGELSIDSTIAENKVFQIAVTIGGATYYQTTSRLTQDILTGLLDKASGNYAVEVVAFDVTGKVMPSPAVIEVRGYRLQGIRSAEIQDTGEIVLTLYSESEAESNITFVARNQNSFQNFTPKKNNDGTYQFAMIEFINLFHIQTNGAVQLTVSVQKTGNVNADWIAIHFIYEMEANDHVTYARGRNMADDYFKIKDVVGTKSFRYQLTFNDTLGNQLQDEQIFTANQLAGFWVTTDEGSYFATELPSGVTNYEACYGMSLNKLVANVSSGPIDIQISRVVYNGTQYVQYNQIIKNYQKLKTVEGLSLRGNRLTWTLSPEPETTGYYVYFYTQEGNEYNLFTYRSVTTAYLDLALTDFISLTPGVRYYVTVVSVSSELGKIASNPTNMLNVYKYKQPESVEVKDGKIQIKEDAFKKSKLYHDIQTYYNSPDFLKVIATTTYEDLFQFTAAGLPTTKVMLQFTRASTNYTTTINAVDLLPDFSADAYKFQQPGMTSKITLLQAIEEMLKLETAHNVYWNDVYALYKAVLNANHGVADYNMLFDDFGAQIPGGTYAVSMKQLGIAGAGTIDSEYSPANELFVISAPALSLSVEETTNRNYYKVGFSTVELASQSGNNQMAERYLMRMVGQNRDGSASGIRYYFHIVNNGTAANPQFMISSYSIPVFDTVVIDGNVHQVERLQTIHFDTPIVLAYQANTKYVTLDITRQLLTTFPNIERQTYQFSIYATGNDYSVNSKTDTVNITLLGFNYQSVTLTEGAIYWKATDANLNYKTRVVYKPAATDPGSLEIAFEDTAFGNNVGVLDLAYDGVYDYIVFTILGSIGRTSMSVDSESYMIENIYKMTAPTAKANHNLLEITGSNRNTDFYQTVQFKIRNDVSVQENPVLNYTTEKLQNTSTYTYEPGLQGLTKKDDEDAAYAYKQTESLANEFYAMSIGMTVPANGSAGSFDRGERIANDNVDYVKADFKLTMHVTNEQGDATVEDQSYVVLSSDEGTIKATMLDSVHNLLIKDGDIVWEAAQATDIPENATAIYQVSVEIYNYGSSSIAPNGTQVFYTTATKLAATHIVKALEGTENYIIHVKTLVGVRSTNKDYDIQTIENEYYQTNAVSYQKEADQDGELVLVDVYLLGSERQTLGALNGDNVILRAQAADTSPANFKISGGVLYWQDTNRLYEYQIVDEFGNEILGKFSKTETTVDGKTLRSWTFVPYDSVENPSLTYGDAHTLTIFAYIPSNLNAANVNSARANRLESAANTLKSYGSTFAVIVDGLTDTNIYKLPSIKDNDFAIVQFAEGGFGINFEKLFADKTILSSQSYYKVRMMVTLTILQNGVPTDVTYGLTADTSMTLVSKDPNKRFEIMLNSDSNKQPGVSVATDARYKVNIYTNQVQNIKLSFRTEDAQDTSSKMLLSGDLSASYDITPAVWSDNDAVEWDDANMQFVWTYGLEDTVSQTAILYTYKDNAATGGTPTMTPSTNASGGIMTIEPSLDGYGKIIPTFISVSRENGLPITVMFEGQSYTKIFWEGSVQYILSQSILQREINIGVPAYEVIQHTPLYAIEMDGDQVQVTQKATIRLTQDSQGALIPQTIHLNGANRFIQVESKDDNGNVIAVSRYFPITYQSQELYILESDFEVVYGTRVGQYQITLTYHDGSKEIAQTSEKYYQPKKMGTITDVKVLVRADEKSLYSMQSIDLTRDIQYKLFAGGDGSASAPYEISSEIEFKNIRLRNTEGSKYYFKQTKDIEVTAAGSAIEGTFYGNYNGQGKTLTFHSISPKKGKTISQTFTSGVSTTNVSFKQFSSLFNELGSGSEVYGLNLIYQIAATSTELEDGTMGTGLTANTLFAGIAITNYGNVHDIVVQSITKCEVTFGGSSGIAFAYGGLVGLNYGKITDCSNKAMVDLTPTSVYNNQIFWAGFTIANASVGTSYVGNLTRCFNLANLTISARRANNMIWLSGITLNNTNGKITQCGNNGDLYAKDSGTGGAYTSFISGICLRMVNGELSYSYNNGNLQSNASSQYIGGVAYTLSSCSISALVETSGTTIAALATNVKNITNSYCYAAYATSGIQISALSEKNIVCSDGKILTIAATGEEFIASIN